MKRVLTVTLVAALALFAGSAYANFCARDVVPATTLLVPYVVVSMDAAGANPDNTGYTTYLSVTNVSNEAQIIHVNVWSADSEGVLDFNQVLSGYDVWAINFADLLSGHWSAFQTHIRKNTGTTLPFEWGPDGRSAYGFTTTAAPYGPGTTDDDWWTGLPLAEATNALPATAVTLCTMEDLNDTTGGQFKGLVIDGLTAPLWARSHNGCGTGQTAQHVTRHLSDWLSGLGDNPIFFYVTVDLFNRCELAFPNTAGYFGQATATGGLVKYENLLIGEVYYVNMTNGYSEATPAVHVESDTDAILNTPAGTVPPNGLGTEFMWEKVTDIANTWGTYEEPLATAFGFRYLNDAPTVTSSVLLWKNQTEFITDDELVDDCGAYLYYAWDMDEHVITRAQQCPVSPCGGADIDPNEFPFEIQEVPITAENFDLPATYGWMLIVLPPSYGTPYVDPTPDLDLLNFEYQGWAGVRIKYQGFSAGIEAATMANAHCFEAQQLPVLGINFDYADGNHIAPWW